jgi:hypothetical protein
LSCGRKRDMSSTKTNVLRIPCLATSFLEAITLWMSYYCVNSRNVQFVYFSTQLDVGFYNKIIREVVPILQTNILKKN